MENEIELFQAEIIETASVQKQPIFKESTVVRISFEEFTKELETKSSPEEKIRFTLEFMISTLSQEGTPAFKDFWDARKFALAQFKESLSAKLRAELWNRYIELTSEARRLKEILDEQSSFAKEQIELAIQSLEQDIEHQLQLATQVAPLEIPQQCKGILAKQEFYQSHHGQLQIINTFASRINSLRNELMKTEIRMRFKNKLFDHLAALGDKVFPKRKELSELISQEFLSDVQAFVKKHFSGDTSRTLPPYILKEEIKGLQSIAKDIHLTTQVFTATRTLLSECWDKLKVVEKERKQEFTQKKEEFKQNLDVIAPKVASCLEKCQQGLLSDKDADKEIAALFEELKTLELDRDDFKKLKSLLDQARKTIYEKADQMAKEKKRAQDELLKQKNEEIQELMDALEQELEKIDAIDSDTMAAHYSDWMSKMQQLTLSENEQLTLSILFKSYKQAILHKKQTLLFEETLSATHLEALNALLDESRKFRLELKQELESYRKKIGGSSLNIAKSMFIQELIKKGKPVLDALDSDLIDLEEKIFDLEKSHS